MEGVLEGIKGEVEGYHQQLSQVRGKRRDFLSFWMSLLIDSYRVKGNCDLSQAHIVRGKYTTSSSARWEKKGLPEFLLGLAD